MQKGQNFSQKTILRPAVIDTTAFGVAVGCLVGMGELSIDDLHKTWKLEKEFKPEPIPYYAQKRSLWDTTIKKLFL